MQTRARGGDDIWKKIGDKFTEIQNNCGKDYPEIYFNLPGNYYQLTGYGKCLWDAIEKYYSTGNIYQKSEKWGGTAFHAIIVTFSVVKVGTLTTAITHFDPIYLTLSTTLKIVKPLIVNGIKVFRCGTKFVTFTGENNTFVLRFIESKGEAFTGDWQQAIRWVEVTDKAGNKYRVGLIGDDLPIRNSPEFSNFDIVRNPDGTPIQVEGQRFLAEISDGQEGHLAVVERLAKTGSRFIAKSGAELKTHLNSITNKPLGKSYTGKWYRYTGNPNYNPTEIYSGMIDAENRFRKGLYLSETKSGNVIEANSYGGTSGKTLFEISDVEVSNLLDLTDANTIEVLGTTFEQMKLTGVTNAYEYTQEIAIWAKNNGYSGIKFYGAQGGTSSYTNFVIFEQSTINNSIKGSVNVIPW